MTPARIFLCVVFLSCVMIVSSVEAGTGPAKRPLAAVISGSEPTARPRAYHAGADTVRVLAVMVQFQKDNDNGTTGDGQFNLGTSAVKTIDPPPHNRRYFADHLTFLSNYFARVSKKKVILTTRVLDSVYTLPSAMRPYSPPKGASNLALANLARDTWHLVDAEGIVDFSQYDCFVVFHAGVGRDLDLASTLGSDPGPADIPSLYLGPNALTSLLGGGISVNHGAATITNTLIMPETESRYLAAIGGDVLLPLGMNGLLCASFGSYLGLPDLFDTNTGHSGIGRFGLMDGESIFSWSGAFPPEPSAWEKFWLGWIQPISVPSGTTTISLPAVALADSVYRVPISQSEYFLLENRNRNPKGTGQRLTIRNGSDSSVVTFARDTTGLNAFDISGINGVVLDVDVPDWSLPGGVSNEGVFYDGGTLIWHIDEAVIAAKIASDAVNADPSRRGVSVVEADGSKDIGQVYGAFTAASGSEQGTELDMWFSGNPAPAYKNEFTLTTIPDSRSNLGADSHISIRGFSGRAPRMAATIIRGDASVSVAPSFPRTVDEEIEPLSLTSYVDLTQTPTEKTSIFVSGTGQLLPPRPGDIVVTSPGLREGRMYRWTMDSTSSTGPFLRSGLFARSGALNTRFIFPPIISDLNGDGVQDVLTVQTSADGTGNWVLRAFTMKDADHDSLADPIFSTPVSRALSTGPTYTQNNSIVAGTTDGFLYSFKLDGTKGDSLKVVSGGRVTGVSSWTTDCVVTGSDGTVAIVSVSAIGASSMHTTRMLSSGLTGPVAVGGFRPIPVGGNGRPTGVVAEELCAATTTDGFLHLLTHSLAESEGLPVHLTGTPVSVPALADIDGDGVRDIVVFTGNTVNVVNVAGISLSGFPRSVPNGATLVSTPVVEDVNGDGRLEIVGIAADGLLYAWTPAGTIVAGFPLLSSPGNSSAVIFPTPTQAGQHSIGIMSASSIGALNAWLTGGVSSGAIGSSTAWPQYQHDAWRFGFAGNLLSGSPLSTSFFPKDRVYNWPNPAYGGVTHIRYYLNADARVTIKIMDMAGDLVKQFDGPGLGGFDNEVSWDVSGVQSGVYFARVEASGGNGSGVAVVKIAIVK